MINSDLLGYPPTMLGLRSLFPCLLLGTCVGKALHIRSQRPASENPQAERQPAFRNQPGCSNGFNFRCRGLSTVHFPSLLLIQHLRSMAGHHSVPHRVQAYTPSRFESEWHQAVSRGDENACQFMLANRERTKIWLETLQVSFVLNRMMPMTP